MRVVVAVLLALALAGCGSKDTGANKVALGDGTRLSLDLPPEQQPAPDDIRGAVSGVVVDEAIFPVPGATVHVRDRDYRAVADADGRFVFEDMAPGLYTLEVSKDEHADGLGTVNVRSGQVAKAVLQVPRLPYVAPYHTTWVFDEVRTADSWLLLSPSGDNEQLVAFDRAPRTVILESAWDGLESQVTDPIDYWVQGESDPDSRETGQGPNPFLKVVEGSFFVKGEYAMRLRVFPTFEATPPEVQGKVFATVFYVDPAPSGWSFIGGDT